MLWAQWTLLVSIVLWNLLSVLVTVVEVNDRKRSAMAIPVVFLVGVILLVLVLLAGAFDKIVGWPL